MLHSIFFRIIILVFSFSIVFNYNGYVGCITDIIISVVYLSIYAYCKKHNRNIVRLINDFIYINIIIGGRNISEPFIFLYVLLPLINAINFTGSKRHTFIILLLTIGTFLLNSKSIEFWWIISILSVAAIYASSWRQLREWEVLDEVSKSIDNFFVLQKQKQKSHSIYEHVIDQLNTLIFYNRNKGITLLRTYVLKDGTLWLIRSSRFVWIRSLTMQRSDIEDLKRCGYLIKPDRNYNEIYTYVKKGDMEYVFITDIENKITTNLLKWRIQYILYNTYSKIALLHNVETKQSEFREKKFNETKENLIYVNTAVDIMHFIRNRATPLKNLITFYKRYNSMPPNVRDKMEDYVKDLVLKADKHFDEILSTADYLLEKSNNPFINPEFKEVKITKVYIILSEIVESVLLGSVKAMDTLQNQFDQNLCIHTNLTELKILFSDWVGNINHYKSEYYFITVSYELGLLKVHFINDFAENNIGYLPQLVKDINSVNKDAVLERDRRGHGINIIKSIAKKLNIKISASIDYDDSLKKNILNFILLFKTYESKENINN